MSDNDNETQADIIREMRRDGIETVDGVIPLDGYADRLEAAAKREREAHTPKPDPNWKDICAKCADSGCSDPPDCEYFGDPNGCNSPIYGQHPAAKIPDGNNAAMREALEDIAMDCLYVAEGISDEGDYGRVTLMRIRDKARAALSAPARNCDVGTPEEQALRYGRFCDKFVSDKMHCETCPCCGKIPFGKCEFAWAQMPYKEGEGAE